MIARRFAFVTVLAGLAAPAGLAAQAADTRIPERAIRHDIPLTNAIRRAFDAGTRNETGRPGPNYWQLQVDYDIDARIEPTTSVVTGSETITIHNNSPDALNVLVLRLDQNVFAANVMRVRIMPEITDGTKITKLVFNGEAVDMTPPQRGLGRGGGPPTLSAFGLDQTVAQIRLPDPVAAGAKATLEVDWRFTVPHAAQGRGLRMGRWADSLYQVAQWYPRVTVYDDLRGWDTEPYLGSSEFYNNYGRFDVRINAPAGWIVGATGVLQNPDEVLTASARERLSHVLESDEVRTIVGASERGPGVATAAGDRLVWHFVADMVNDFAWATSDEYVWDATRATIPEHGPVPIHILYLPGSEQQYERVGPTTRHALEFYSGLWMPYAFPQLTVVDGPDRGMEYPMFIMSALGAADHEAGHEWWPMMVGTNETWYGFMDEGFNQYMGILSRQHLNDQPFNLNRLGQQYGQISGDEREGPLMWNANYGGPMYGFQAYQKAPLMLSMLGGIVGDTAVWRAMSEYSHTWLFKHPSPWDYAFFMSESLGRDLGWFWYYWLFTTESVEGSIQNVSTAGPVTTVTVHQAGQMPSPVVLGVKFAEGGPAGRPIENAEMLDDNRAVVTWPVDVWFDGSRTFEARLDFGGRAIESITLDPWCRFPDRVVTDNIWPRDAAPPPSTQGGRGGGFGGGQANTICW